MDVLSFPFSFNPLQAGEFGRVPQGSDTQKAQELSSFFLTHKGERGIHPEFGIDDPTFSEFDDSQVAADFALFYGDISINAISISGKNDGTRQIGVDFE